MPKDLLLTDIDDGDVQAVMGRAQALVRRDFDAKEHLPGKIHDLVDPISNMTCQGNYAVAMMLIGAMPAITNGAAVPLWNEKGTPLSAVVIQIGKPQDGKSRLTPIIEEVFDTCDDCVEALLAEKVREYQALHQTDSQRAASERAAPRPQAVSHESPADERAGGLGAPDEYAETPIPLSLTSISLQSFTFPELFFRCSESFPQVKIDGKGTLPKAIPQRLWYGVGVNLDEAYEFLDNLGLLCQRSDKGSSPTVHASTLNLLLQAGKTRRATRTSASFGQSRGKHVSLSIVGNAHPTKMIPLERGLIGNHTAATKERFLFCLDTAAPRYADLPKDSILPQGKSRWTWLPLALHTAAVLGWEMHYNSPDRAAQAEGGLEETLCDEPGLAAEVDRYVGPPWGYAVSFPDGTPSRLRVVKIAEEGSPPRVRTEYRISARWALPDPTAHVRACAKRAADFFARRPHDKICFTEAAHKAMLGNQVAQAVRAQLAGSDITAPAQHAQAAGQQGVVAACLAVLDFAAGGGDFAEEAHGGHLLISEAHVNAAWRLVDICLGIKAIFRMDPSVGHGMDDPSQGPSQISRPLRGEYMQRFARPLSTQAPLRPQRRATMLALTAQVLEDSMIPSTSVTTCKRGPRQGKARGLQWGRCLHGVLKGAATWRLSQNRWPPRKSSRLTVWSRKGPPTTLALAQEEP